MTTMAICCVQETDAIINPSKHTDVRTSLCPAISQLEGKETFLIEGGNVAEENTPTCLIDCLWHMPLKIKFFKRGIYSIWQLMGTDGVGQCFALHSIFFIVI